MNRYAHSYNLTETDHFVNNICFINTYIYVHVDWIDKKAQNTDVLRSKGSCTSSMKQKDSE